MKDDQLILTVTELSGKIKSLLDANLSNVCVRGEISGLKIATSGHAYFSLKDQNSLISAICWKNTLSKLNFKISDGLEILATGKVSSYAGQSKYQIYVDKFEPYGLGAFAKIFEERKKKLQEAGLFDLSKKKKIPFLPRTIGIVTSLTGAVIRDIIHRINDRLPTKLIIWPVSVQGVNSSNEITNAIIGFNKYNNLKPDLIIVARGGGSVEDLWSFNEENVVMAISDSKIPIISAIGHETDYSLSDLVSDLRAPTPTASAEFAVPARIDLLKRINDFSNYLSSKIKEKLKIKYMFLENKSQFLYHFFDKIHSLHQNVDELDSRMHYITESYIRKQKLLFDKANEILNKPTNILRYKLLEYNQIANRIKNMDKNILERFHNRLETNARLISSLDYKKILKRGFSIIQSNSGEFISSAKAAKEKEVIQIQFIDETITAKIIK